MSSNAIGLSQQAQKQVLSSDIVVVEIGGFFIGIFKDFFYFSCQGRIAIDLNFRTIADQFFDFIAYSFKIDIQIAQDIDSDSLS